MLSSRVVFMPWAQFILDRDDGRLRVLAQRQHLDTPAHARSYPAHRGVRPKASRPSRALYVPRKWGSGPYWMSYSTIYHQCRLSRFQVEGTDHSRKPLVLGGFGFAALDLRSD